MVPQIERSSRRRFLAGMLQKAAGLALLPVAGCSLIEPEGPGGPRPPSGGYPLVDVGGSYREIGRGLGSAMKGPIQSYLKDAGDFSRCVAFSRDRRADLERLLENVRRRFPHLVEEMAGMAEGAGVPFEHLLAYNCRSEIAILSQGQELPPAPGCSTIVLCGGGKVVLAHNEDGSDANVGRMCVARVKPPSGVDFIAFVYPGLLPGNGPGCNRRGVVQTTNYIAPRTVSNGVPRYFIGRAALEARSLADAVDIVTAEGRAFPWHHNLASLPDGKYLSVETFPGKSDVLEPEGVYVHTNHFIHPKMAGDDTIPRLAGTSSLTRLRVLTQAIRVGGAPEGSGDMVRLLSSHEGLPYSPCRHPEGDVHGITLGTALFEGPKLGMTLYHGNPCLGLQRRYPW